MDIVDLWRAHFENSFKFHGSHDELVDRYKIFISNLVVGLFPFTKSFSSLHHRKDSYRTGYMCYTADFLLEITTAYPLREPGFTHAVFVGSFLLEITTAYPLREPGFTPSVFVGSFLIEITTAYPLREPGFTHVVFVWSFLIEITTSRSILGPV